MAGWVRLALSYSKDKPLLDETNIHRMVRKQRKESKPLIKAAAKNKTVVQLNEHLLARQDIFYLVLQRDSLEVYNHEVQLQTCE
jgi:hypothetical protein